MNSDKFYEFYKVKQYYIRGYNLFQQKISIMKANNKTVVITGSARRLGREMALALASSGFSIVIHSSTESPEVNNTILEIKSLGGKVKFIRADFSDPEATTKVFSGLFDSDKSIYALINNASIFPGGSFLETTYDEWQKNISINLSAPFLISQSFARAMGSKPGRIINMLDWRALRPGKDHFAYTISKAGLASMTSSMALALAPNITVNGLALGAILPPSDGGYSESVIKPVPAARWADVKEVTDTVIFLLTGPEYITGEIIHIDGGRHLV